MEKDIALSLLRNMGALELAWLGDGVYELEIRSRILVSGARNTHLMTGIQKGYSSARAQMELLNHLLPMLSDEERAVVKRGTRSKHNRPKNSTERDYMSATALECLFGWLYLLEESARITALVDEIMEYRRLNPFEKALT